MQIRARLQQAISLSTTGISKMAVVYFTGFEAGSAEPFYGASGTYSIQSTTKKSGTYAFKSNPTTTGVGYFNTWGLLSNGVFPNNLPVTSYTKFDFYYVTKPASNDEQIFCIRDYSTGNYKLEVRLTSTGVIKVYDKDLLLVATGTTVLSANTWYRIEVKGGNGTSVAYEVKINGASEVSGTCNQLASNSAGVNFGKQANRNSNSVEFYYDNVVVDDAAYPGDCVVTPIFPTGNGGTAQWTGGTGSSNYLEVDEVPPDSDTTYIRASGSAGDVHLVTLQSTATAGITGTVKSFKAMAYVRENTPVTSATKVRIKSGASSSDTSGYDYSTSYLWIQNIANTDPNTSAAWTLSGIDNVQIGVVESNAVQTRCSAIYGMVLHTPSSASADNGGMMMRGIGG